MKFRPLISILLISSIILLATGCGGGGGGGAAGDGFAVNYIVNGAESGAGPVGQYSHGEEVTISDNTGNLAKAGYLFDGWNTKADGTGKDYAPGAKYKGDELFLYAKWAPIYLYDIVDVGLPAPALDGIQKSPGDGVLSLRGLAPAGTRLSVFNIPSAIDGITVKYIASAAFQNNYNMISVTLPETLAVIGGSSFQGCINLTSLVLLGTTPPTLAGGALDGCPVTISVPVSAVDTYKAEGGWDAYSASIFGYTDEPHTVTFDSQGATTPASPASMTVNPPSVIVGTLPTPPQKTGYNFGGWFTGTGGTGTEFTATTPFTINLTVYAYWEEYSYTVAFDDQGATTPVSPDSKTVNSPATTIDALPTAPAKNGQIFAGWYTQTGGGGAEFTADTVVTGNMTVYAYWADYSYTVTFDDQGATTHVNPASKKVNSPATTVGSLPTAPEKTNNGFGGWYTQPGGAGDEFTAGTTVTGNITVYAKWIPVYTVTFDDQGATTHVNPATKVVIPPATKIDALPTAPQKTGYVFGGWYTQTGGAGTQFTADTTVNSSITVYAKWDSYSYTVTFDGQSATTPASPASKTVNSPATTVGSLPTAPQKTGYIFGGWYTGTGGSGDPFTADTVVTGNITVFAKWDDYSYTVNFDDQGATTPVSPTSKTVNSPATTVGSLPTAPQRTGFIFDGWYTSPKGAGTAFTAGTTVNGNITVYAKWSVDMVAIPSKTYKMLRTEVTQALYEAIMGTNPSQQKGRLNPLDDYNSPVENITWYDAVAFCNALSTYLGLTPVYTINGEDVTQDTSKSGFRLPTKEEWQYAAAGGEAYTYAGSNTIDDVAWYHDNAGGSTHPVGQKEPNGYGLYDMSGNVDEWCSDERAWEYMLGGDYYDDAEKCEVLYETYNPRNTKGSNLGIRVVCKQ